MVKRLALLAVLLLAAAALSCPASANLVPIAWGFPVLVQNASLTNMQTASASASDMESANIAFPTAGVGGGLFGGAFPTISQFANQNANQMNMLFANQNQNMIFAYPYISIGGAPVPGMGFL
jgi:hypothetical protein